MRPEETAHRFIDVLTDLTRDLPVCQDGICSVGGAFVEYLRRTRPGQAAPTPERAPSCPETPASTPWRSRNSMSAPTPAAGPADHPDLAARLAQIQAYLARQWPLMPYVTVDGT